MGSHQFWGVLAGTALWIVLFFFNRKSPLSFRRLLAVMIAAGVGCRLIFSLGLPTFSAPDEEAHFKYVRYLSERHAFPVQTSKTGDPTNDNEYYQPPLYYLLQVPVYRLANHVSSDVGFIVRMLRLSSLALWLAGLLFGLKVIANLRVENEFIRTATACLLCLIPSHVFLTSVINNDNLAFTLGAATICFLSGKCSYRRSLLTGILLGLGLLTKLTAVVGVFLAALLFLLRWRRRELTFAQTAAHFALLFLPAMLLWLPWGIRNVTLYGDLTAEKIANVRWPWASPLQAAYSTQDLMKISFWSIAGQYNGIMFYPGRGLALTYLALLGIAEGLLTRDRPLARLLAGDRGSFLLACALGIVFNLALVFRFGILYGQGQGRFLFPMLIPVALAIAGGLALLGIPKLSRNMPIHFLGFFAIYVFPFVGYCFDCITRG